MLISFWFSNDWLGWTGLLVIDQIEKCKCRYLLELFSMRITVKFKKKTGYQATSPASNRRSPIRKILTFGRVGFFVAAAMFRIVMYKHIFRGCKVKAFHTDLS